MVFDGLQNTFSKLASFGKDVKKTVEDSVSSPVQKVQTTIVRHLPLLPKSTLFEDIIDRIKRDEYVRMLDTVYQSFQKALKKEGFPEEDYRAWRQLGKEIMATLALNKTTTGRFKIIRTIFDQIDDLIDRNKFPGSVRDGEVVMHQSRGLKPKEKELYKAHLKWLRTDEEHIQEDLQKYILPQAYTPVPWAYNLHDEVKGLKDEIVHGMDALVNDLIKRISDQRAIEKLLYGLKRDYAAYQTAKNKWDKAQEKVLAQQCEDILRKELQPYTTHIEASKKEEAKLHASFATTYEAFQTHFTTRWHELLKWYEVRLQQNRVDIEAARQQGAADKKAKNAISQRLDACLTKWQAVVHTKDTKTYSTMRTLFAEQTQEYEDLAEAEYAYVTWFYRTWYGYEAAATYAHTMISHRNSYTMEWMIQLKAIQMYTKLYLRLKQRYITVVKDILNILLDVRNAPWKEVKMLETMYQKELDEVGVFVQTKEKEIIKNEEKIEEMKKEFGEIDGADMITSGQHDLLQRMYWLEAISRHTDYLQYVQKVVGRAQEIYGLTIAFLKEMLQSKGIIADDKRASLSIHKTLDLTKELKQLEQEIEEYEAFLDHIKHEQQRCVDINDNVADILNEYAEKQRKYTREQHELEASLQKQAERSLKYTLFVLPQLIQGKQRLLPEGGE